MANIMRRERDRDNEIAPPTTGLDPFRMLRDLGGWEAFREIESFNPSFDVRETDSAYIIIADLPGVQEQDLEVSVAGNRITVSGKREEERRDEGDQYYAYERSYGSFARSFTLPDGADPERVSADLKGGVLKITAPKRPEVQPKKISLKEKVSNVAETVKEKLTGKPASGSQSGS